MDSYFRDGNQRIGDNLSQRIFPINSRPGPEDFFLGPRPYQPSGTGGFEYESKACCQSSSPTLCFSPLKTKRGYFWLRGWGQVRLSLKPELLFVI